MRKKINFCAHENLFSSAQKFPALRTPSRFGAVRDALCSRLGLGHEEVADFTLVFCTAQGGMSLVGMRAVGEGP